MAKHEHVSSCILSKTAKLHKAYKSCEQVSLWVCFVCSYVCARHLIVYLLLVNISFCYSVAYVQFVNKTKLDMQLQNCKPRSFAILIKNQ